MKKKKLNEVLENFSNIQEKLSKVSSENFKEYESLSKEFAQLKPIVEKINYLMKLRRELEDLGELLISEDLEIREEAGNEKEKLNNQILSIEEN